MFKNNSTSLIIHDSENNILNNKHNFDSTNALSPLGQEAIEILDDLCNTLDDQTKIDQNPYGKSLESTNENLSNKIKYSSNKFFFFIKLKIKHNFFFFLEKLPSTDNILNYSNKGFIYY